MRLLITWKLLFTDTWTSACHLEEFAFHRVIRRGWHPFSSSLTRSKSRIGQNRRDRLREINRRISEVISQNRRNLLQAPVGAREWWKHVDSLSQRRCSSAKVTLDMQSLAELNDYFAELCWDSAYKQPTPAQVESVRFQKDRYGTVCGTWRKPPLDRTSYRFGCGETPRKFLHL